MSRLLRIWLLVLLTALLPVRGALAAAMLCAPAVPASAAGHGEHRGHHEGADAAQHAHHEVGGEHQQHDHNAQHDAKHDGGDRCSLCASCCTTVPLMAAIPGVPEPFDAPQQFPALRTPAPSFVSGGWDRPPRRI